MSDIAAFILARLDEDEAAARRCAPGPWGLDGVPRDRGVFSEPTGVTVARGWLRDTDHIARHDPARVLAEVAAKRAIVDRYERAQRSRRDHPGDLASAGAFLALHGVVKLLAQAAADHPDYDPSWRVG